MITNVSQKTCKQMLASFVKKVQPIGCTIIIDLEKGIKMLPIL